MRLNTLPNSKKQNTQFMIMCVLMCVPMCPNVS